MLISLLNKTKTSVGKISIRVVWSLPLKSYSSFKVIGFHTLKCKFMHRVAPGSNQIICSVPQWSCELFSLVLPGSCATLRQTWQTPAGRELVETGEFVLKCESLRTVSVAVVPPGSEKRGAAGVFDSRQLWRLLLEQCWSQQQTLLSPSDWFQVTVWR